MVDQLVARIVSPPFQPIEVEWAIFRGRELILGVRTGSLEQVTTAVNEMYQQRPVIRVSVLVPMEWVSIVCTPMPSVQPKVLSKALPFALEDQLAEDVEWLHFTVLGKPTPDQVRVAVIKKALISFWLDHFKSAGFQINEMVPDALCLPYGSPEHWSLIFHKDRVLLRCDRHQAMAFQGSQVAVMLDTIFEEMGANQTELKLTLINLKNEVIAGRVLDALAAEISGSQVDTKIELDRRHLDRPVLEILNLSLLNQQVKRQVPNLLVGEFKQEVRQQRAQVKWKPLVALVALVLVLQSVYFGWQGRIYAREADKLEEQAVSLYRSFFPSERVNSSGSLKRRLQVKLKQAGQGGSGFLTSLQTVGSQIYAIDRGKSDTITLKRVVFDQKNGQLRLELSLSDFSVMSQLKSAIEKQGGQVEEDAVSRGSDGRITARVRIAGL